jgi:acetyl esterase/lipase
MRTVLAFAAAVVVAAPALAQDKTYTHTEDVIYGRKFGLAMTLDVFAPKDKTKANGAAVIYCVSGGWFSSKDAVPVAESLGKPFLDRGYTVFAVVHGSQPRFTIPEVLDDMHRAVRFVRHTAKEYGVDPDRLGITGISAGGHLSLMQGVAGKPGNPKANDPVERESSRVGAVGAFCPPTDFFNWGEEGVVAQPGSPGPLQPFRAPFDFVEFDSKARAFDRVTDPGKREVIYKQISPAYHVTPAAAPAIIFHGDKDGLVPVNQAEIMAAKYKAAGVPCELVIKKGADHVWPDIPKDFETVADWFDKHLGKSRAGE